MVISGAQTGADRGALIAAAILGYEHGGWVPPGRLAEDGQVPSCYPMTELTSGGYPERTRMNVECSDATIIFTYTEELNGGSALTMKRVRAANLPGLHMFLYPGASLESNKRCARAIREWLMAKKPRVLNVAGSRESKAEGLQNHVAEIMLLVLQAPSQCICARPIPEEVWEKPDVKEKDIALRCSACRHPTQWSDFSWISQTSDVSTSDEASTDGCASTSKTSSRKTSSA
jgi:hypothetical protein